MAVGDKILVSIPVTPEAADKLHDPNKVRAVGAVISDLLLRSDDGPDHLLKTIRELKAEAHANGLTDEMVDEELAAHNAERRS